MFGRHRATQRLLERSIIALYLVSSHAETHRPTIQSSMGIEDKERLFSFCGGRPGAAPQDRDEGAGQEAGGADGMSGAIRGRWAAIGPQPRGGTGVTALLTAYRGQSGGAGRMAMLAAPWALTLQLHERSLLLRIGTAQAVMSCAAAVLMTLRGRGHRRCAGGRWRTSAAWVISSSSKAMRTPEMDRPAALAKSISLYGPGVGEAAAICHQQPHVRLEPEPLPAQVGQRGQQRVGALLLPGQPQRLGRGTHVPARPPGAMSLYASSSSTFPSGAALRSGRSGIRGVSSAAMSAQMSSDCHVDDTRRYRLQKVQHVADSENVLADAHVPATAPSTRWAPWPASWSAKEAVP